MAHPRSGCTCIISRSNWNFEMLECWFLRREAVPGEKSLGAEGENENQQQIHPTYDADSGNQTRTPLVGGIFLLCQNSKQHLEELIY